MYSDVRAKLKKLTNNSKTCIIYLFGGNEWIDFFMTNYLIYFSLQNVVTVMKLLSHTIFCVTAVKEIETMTTGASYVVKVLTYPRIFV